MPGLDYGPDGFGTGLTPLHLSDDGEGGAFHFHDPPPPYTAFKYPDIQHPDDPPPSYEASLNPATILIVSLNENNSQTHRSIQPPLETSDLHPETTEERAEESSTLEQSSEELEDSIDSSTLLVPPDSPTDETTATETAVTSCDSNCSLNTVV